MTNENQRGRLKDKKSQKMRKEIQNDIIKLREPPKTGDISLTSIHTLIQEEFVDKMMNVHS